MGIIGSVGGVMGVEVVSADPAQLLRSIHEARLRIYDVELQDALTLRLKLHRRDWGKLQKLLTARGDRCRIYTWGGLYWQGKRFLARPLLLAGICLFLAAALFLPGRIFFVRVDGNSQLPKRLVQEKAELCGIGFGAKRKAVRSEKVKNALLEQLPQLQWAGVNTAGCVATVSVKERTPEPEKNDSSRVGSIVAVQDGVITECTVMKGSPLCKVGQAVKTGDILVSGYTDCGTVIKATLAEGEVFALTKRDLQLKIPLTFETKGEQMGRKRKLSLIFGKKRINFYKDSGISEVSCDKMYAEYYLTLPGGFALPVALAVEEWIYYDPSVTETSADTAIQALSQLAKGYLSEQMLSGEILTLHEETEQSDDCVTLYAEYTCREMIGRISSEEIINSNGESD